MLTETEFTFENGKKARITRVSMFVFREAEAQVPRPQPPTQSTELGEQENEAHPDHITALIEWQKRVNDRRIEALIQFGVDADIDQEELDAFKKRAARAKMTLPEDDLVTWVRFICMTTGDDFIRLQEAIIGASIPTEQEIGKQADSFKSEVEGPSDSEGASAAIGGDG